VDIRSRLKEDIQHGLEEQTLRYIDEVREKLELFLQQRQKNVSL
jgi:non-homologous end joining protein Ku